MYCAHAFCWAESAFNTSSRPGGGGARRRQASGGHLGGGGGSGSSMHLQRSSINNNRFDFNSTESSLESTSLARSKVSVCVGVFIVVAPDWRVLYVRAWLAGWTQAYIIEGIILWRCNATLYYSN